MTTKSDLEVAVFAAVQAAGVGLDYFTRLGELDHRLKSDGSPVTDADVAIESAIRVALVAERPDDAVTGEESGHTGTGHRRWILDGIDGTFAFIQGDHRWQTLIALEVDGTLEVGVAVLPVTSEIFYAQRGRGAFRDTISDDQVEGHAVRLQSRSTASLEDADVTLVPPVSFLRPEETLYLESFIEATNPAVPERHGALLVALGKLDLCLEVDGQEWDYAALRVIVEEAGAFFDQIDGSGPLPGLGVFSATQPLLNQTRSLVALTGATT